MTCSMGMGGGHGGMLLLLCLLFVLELLHSLPTQIHTLQADPHAFTKTLGLTRKQCSHQEDQANIGTEAIAGQLAQEAIFLLEEL